MILMITGGGCFFAGFGIAALLAIAIAGKTILTLVKFKLTKDKIKNKLFAVHEAKTGKCSMEIGKKEEDEDPFYHLKNGVLALDPTMFETAQPQRLDKDIEIYNCSPQTPVLIDAKGAVYLNTMIPKCRAAHPELNFLGDDDLGTIIFTPRSELWHDCINYPLPDSDGEEDDEFTSDEFYAAILDCQDICADLALVDHGDLIDTSSDEFSREEEVVERDDAEPAKGLKGIISNILHPSKKIITIRSGTAKYPPMAYYWNYRYSYEVMPYSHDTVSITKAINLIRSLAERKSKKSFGDVMKYAMIPLFCCMGIAILLIVVNTVILKGGGI